MKYILLLVLVIFVFSTCDKSKESFQNNKNAEIDIVELNNNKNNVMWSHNSHTFVDDTQLEVNEQNSRKHILDSIKESVVDYVIFYIIVASFIIIPSLIWLIKKIKDPDPGIFFQPHSFWDRRLMKSCKRLSDNEVFSFVQFHDKYYKNISWRKIFEHWVKQTLLNEEKMKIKIEWYQDNDYRKIESDRKINRELNEFNYDTNTYTPFDQTEHDNWVRENRMNKISYMLNDKYYEYKFTDEYFLIMKYSPMASYKPIVGSFSPNDFNELFIKYV